jgi:pilus assembly protein Flp/PilA
MAFPPWWRVTSGTIAREYRLRIASTIEGGLMLRSLKRAVVEFCRREDGPTAVEYAVMLALIIVVCLTAIQTLGQNANKTFQTVGTKLGSASS